MRNKDNSLPHWIYFLIERGQVVYIGVTKSLSGRMKAHIHKNHDCVRVVKLKNKSVATHYETRWIRFFKPKLNIKGFEGTERQSVNVHINSDRAARLRELARNQQRTNICGR